MTKTVTVIDYGLGNLFSVAKAFEHVGANIEITSDIKKISSANYLVLPGVGAFNKGMEELRKLNLIESIKEYVLSNRPLMGICLGMQMLFDIGMENGEHKGLGIISGNVEKISAKKIPNIGWCKLNATREFKADGKEFYFVHSYHAICSNKQDLLASITYEGQDLTAAVKKGNIIGYQFHPEKSRQQGLDLCKGFLEI